MNFLLLFQEGRTGKAISQEIGAAYGTTVKAGVILRLALRHANHFTSDGLGLIRRMSRQLPLREVDSFAHQESPAPLFLAGVQNGQIVVRQVESSSATESVKTEIPMALPEDVIIIEPNDNQNAFFFRCHPELPMTGQRTHTIPPACRNPLAEFWEYLDSGLRRYHGVSRERLPLYVEEQVFRFNHRGQYLYPILARALCAFMPDESQSRRFCMTETREPRLPHKG